MFLNHIESDKLVLISAIALPIICAVSALIVVWLFSWRLKQ